MALVGLVLALWATGTNAEQDGDNVGVEAELICNICGCDDCTFADPLGVVSFVYMNKAEKRPCQQLQQEVENPTIYNTTYCHDVIWRKAFEPCLCYNENFPDLLLRDIPGYGERDYGNSGTLQDDPLPFECRNDGEWTFTQRNGNTRRCRWVRKKPGKRCRIRGDDGRRAFEACPRACGNDAEWLAQVGSDRQVGCRWVARKPKRRCRKRGIDNRLAFKACAMACCEYNHDRLASTTTTTTSGLGEFDEDNEYDEDSEAEYDEEDTSV